MNLSSVDLTADQVQVLKLGLTFCPSTDLDRFQLIKDIHLFARRLLFKVIYDKTPSLESSTSTSGEPSEAELRALADLECLWDEGHTTEDVTPMASGGMVVSGVSFPPPTSFKPKSRNFPSLQTNPNIWAFVQQITQEIENLDLQQVHTHNLPWKL